MASGEINKDSELSNANSVRVLETNILHASDVIYWLDGSSAEQEDDMTRITHPLQVIFSEKPRAMKVLHSTGRTAMWRSVPLGDEEADWLLSSAYTVDGQATEEQRERPALASFDIAGEVVDLTGRYNPRSFSLANLGSGDGVGVVLYPSLTGTRLPSAGILQGRLKFSVSEEPVSWGLLELEVTLAVAETMAFKAQADGNGDFRIALKRLPPLPESVTEYEATLRLTADTSATSEDIVDISDFVSMEIESLTVADDFNAELELDIRPGEIQRINSFNKNHMAIETA